MSIFPYLRDTSRPFNELDFPPPDVLDVTELCRHWLSWLELTKANPSPIRSRHAVWLARMLTGEDELIAPNWFSTVSVTSARYQVVRQARAEKYLCTEPAGLAGRCRLPRWQELVDRLTSWDEQDVSHRIVVVGLLTQLGFHRQVVRLVGELSMTPSDPFQQQLAYEVCRAAYQLNRSSQVPFEVFEWLAQCAVRPALRTLSALQLVSARARNGRDHALTSRWLAAATATAANLDEEPAWLAHLVRSRYHRAAALHYLTERNLTQVTVHMSAALDHDDALAELADQPLQVHYQQENRSLVLEAFLKLDLLVDRPVAPTDAVRQLSELDPLDPEPGYAIGAHHASRGDWLAAAGAFWKVAQSGTVRGAMAACAAGQCLERLSRVKAARTAYQLTLDLDPAATTVTERLRALTSASTTGLTVCGESAGAVESTAGAPR
jgi:tetratricopeptide (TPR) repeat protein